MEKRIKVILGTSLTAKIFAFYNREFKIIGKNKSLTKTSFLKNLIFLQDDNFNRMFLSDLSDSSGKEIEFEFKHIDVLTFDEKIGYKKETSKEEKLAIIEKKLTDLNGKKLQFKSNVFQEEIILSEESNGDLKIIEVDFDKINELADEVIKNQVIDDSEISKISFDQRSIDTEKASYEFSELVNTLSLRKLAKISDLSVPEFETLDTTVVEGSEELFGIPKIPYSNAIVYFPQKRFEFGKIVKREGKCYAEITGESKNFKGELSKDARLIKSNIAIPFRNVMMLGRYAEWDPNSRIQDVVRKSSQKLIMQNVWTDQKCFSEKFFDFKEDLSCIQSNVKQQAMLLMQETFDLLNKINWKSHCAEKKLNIEEIKEEWIDIYKYWLTIGINLGINYENFIDALNKKNKKLENKLKEMKIGEKQ